MYDSQDTYMIDPYFYRKSALASSLVFFVLYSGTFF